MLNFSCFRDNCCLLESYVRYVSLRLHGVKMMQHLEISRLGLGGGGGGSVDD